MVIYGVIVTNICDIVWKSKITEVFIFDFKFTVIMMIAVIVIGTIVAMVVMRREH